MEPEEKLIRLLMSPTSIVPSQQPEGSTLLARLALATSNIASEPLGRSEPQLPHCPSPTSFVLQHPGHIDTDSRVDIALIDGLMKGHPAISTGKRHRNVSALSERAPDSPDVT